MSDLEQSAISSEEDSENSSNGSLSSNDSVDETNDGCYFNEPEYTPSELRKRKLPDEDTNTGESSEEDLDSSRLENLHWCTCQQCVIFESSKMEECKCCQECKTLLGNKLNNIKCITLNEEFSILCLNRIVLQTACIRHRRYQNKFSDIKIFTNK